MSINLSRTEYICDCGEDWGSCGKKSGFIMSYNRSCDLGTIFHYHGDKCEAIGTYTDDGLASLSKLLRLGDADKHSEEDNDIYKKFNFINH